MATLLDHLASDTILDRAYRWLCHTRAHYHHNDDVWHVRHWWAREKPLLQAQLLAGTYHLSECRAVQGRERRSELWCAMDALVLKALAIVLGAHLQPHLSRRCFHLTGTGGLKGAVRDVARQLPAHRFVFRTDVKSYYASIDHRCLLTLVQRYVDEPTILSFVQQYLTRVVSNGGVYTALTRGIALGCPLSPLMGALYLKPLDDRMAQLAVGSVRYMDDWVVLAPTRWKLRAAIRAVNEVMADLLVRQHPDKTFIGRIARGFDFLGYRFSAEGLAVAWQTVERCIEQMSRRYAQGADPCRIGTYLQRWERWVRAGLGGMVGAGMPQLLDGLAERWVSARTTDARNKISYLDSVPQRICSNDVESAEPQDTGKTLGE
jgi:RNA-directed DNA polymerase